MTRGDLARGNRPLARVQRNINNSSNSKQTFAGEKWHVVGTNR